MPGGGFGGDSSVVWRVDVDHVRLGSTQSNPSGQKGHHQHGTDETLPGQYFTVFVKVPRDPVAKKNLADALAAAAVAMGNLPVTSGAKVSFSLPIEDVATTGIQGSRDSTTILRPEDY